MKALAIALHAEKLHDDSVWQVVERLAVGSAERQALLTFFVHPFWAAKAGRDIAGRVRRLTSIGHEVGQHTHYYDTASGKPSGHKATDLSAANVLRRLDEDHQTLSDAGAQPRGFVSGAWAVPDTLTGWLTERGFTYDCTYRTYTLPYQNAEAVPGDGAHGPFWLERGLLEVPTTTPLRAGALGAFRRHPSVVRVGDLEYQLVYLHDDDLLDARKRVALRVLMSGFQGRGYKIITADELAGMVRTRIGVIAP